jgi:hypothetical protein
LTHWANDKYNANASTPVHDQPTLQTGATQWGAKAAPAEGGDEKEPNRSLRALGSN